MQALQRSPASLSRNYRADILALVAYLVLAIFLTYPLILHFTTHVVGDGSDDPALAWNLWWVPYSILNLNSSPIYTNYMFYPIGLNLAFYTLTYLNAFLSIPFQFAFNLVVAANVNLLLSFTLSGFGAYLLVKYLLQVTRRTAQGVGLWTLDFRLAAFIAGALYAFSSNKLLYASLGQFNIASSHWIPFYVLFLLKLTAQENIGVAAVQSPPVGSASNVDERRQNRLKLHPERSRRTPLRYGILLGLFLLFQALSEFIFASFLIIFTGVYLLYLLFRRHWQLITDYRILITLLLAALTFTLPMLPILSAMIQDMLTEGDFIQQGLGFADVFSSDVLGFFVPSHLNPIFGGLEAQFDFAYTNFAYLGFAALALAMIALWKIPQARIWGVFAAIFILITLGPNLRVNGDAIPAPFLPFNILLEIPFVKGNRYPSRWSVMVTLALAVMVGYGLMWLLHKLRVSRRRLSTVYCLLFTVLLTEHLSVPLPLSNFQIPSVYQTIAQDKGDFTVLEIPLAWRNGFRMTGTLDAEMMFAQWYQTAHRHPILGGNTSRNPEFKFQYFAQAPVISSIVAIETGHNINAGLLQRNKEIAPDVLRFFGVRYVVWHSPRDPQNRAALEAARAYIEQVLPVTKFFDETDETGQTVAYRVNNAEALPSQVTIGGRPPENETYPLAFGEGWTAPSPFFWAQRREARVFARLDPRSAEARIELSAVAPPSLEEQTVSIRVNGQLVGKVVLTQCLDCKPGLRIPAGILRAGLNEIVLQFERVVPVKGIQMAHSYMIGRNGPVSPVNLTVVSAGSEVGDFAHIYVDGRDVSLNRRGYNIVVLNQQTGAVEASAAFDTFASESESARLAQFIAEVPNGRIVAVAVRDEASRYLTSDAVNALRSLGAKEDLRGKWRWSHAIIGVKGAPPGTALEMASETMPAQVVVGIGATEPNVAAAVEWIKIEK